MDTFGWQAEEAEPGNHLQYLYLLDHGKQVRGLWKTVDTDPESNMGLIVACICVSLLSQYINHPSSAQSLSTIPYWSLLHFLIFYFTPAEIPLAYTHSTEHPSLFDSGRTVPVLLEEKHTVNKWLLREKEPQSALVILVVATANRSTAWVQHLPYWCREMLSF